MMHVPTEDLTSKTFREAIHALTSTSSSSSPLSSTSTNVADYTDRQLFAWAYQTETRIRFEKLEARRVLPSPSQLAAGASKETAETKKDSGTAAAAETTTLASEYLIDVYPKLDRNKDHDDDNAIIDVDDDDDNDDTNKEALLVLRRDLMAYHRQADPALQTRMRTDGTLTPIHISDKNGKDDFDDDDEDEDEDEETKQRRKVVLQKRQDMFSDGVAIDGIVIFTKVLKKFNDGLVYRGTIVGYDANNRFYKIRYDDNDEEEMEDAEVRDCINGKIGGIDEKDDEDDNDEDDDDEDDDEDDDDDLVLLPVPPNYLYFLMCLECYTGYPLIGLFNDTRKPWYSEDEQLIEDGLNDYCSSQTNKSGTSSNHGDGLFNSKNTAVPRGAIMGGAVVAALTSWNDPKIVALFQPLERVIDALLLLSLSSKEKNNRACSGTVPKTKRRKKTNNNPMKTLIDEYITTKTEIMTKLNDYFLQSSSPYNDGDVDFFLAASPHTRTMLDDKGHNSINNSHHPTTGLNSITNVVSSCIEKFLGGVGWCHDDLNRFATRMISQLEKDYKHIGKFVSVLTRNGLSFMFAPVEDHDNSWAYSVHNRNRKGSFYDKLIWPRPTQLIMLDRRADLLGALLDFDLSVVSCAFDGVSVRITPRAALSLLKRIVVITPFCFEEKRNRKRVIKYNKRGFQPFIIDPNNIDTSANEFDDEKQTTIVVYNPSQMELMKGGYFRSRSFHTEEEYNAIIAKQIESVNNGQRLKFCCCPDLDRHSWGYPYTMELFEKFQGDGLLFFKKLFDWNEAKYETYVQVPSHLRVACKKCRNKYGINVFLQEEHPVDDRCDTLRADKTLKVSTATKDYHHLKPSFYGGAAFDATLSKGSARIWMKAISTIRSQSTAEKHRYLIQHNTLVGYKQRFTYSSLYSEGNYHTRPELLYGKNYLQAVFDKASKLVFPETGRTNPVGLNPERFIAKCKKCFTWLHRAKYGTTHCEKCTRNQNI